MIWNFCGQDMHAAASCLWLCNTPSPPTHRKSVKKRKQMLWTILKAPYSLHLQVPKRVSVFLPLPILSLSWASTSSTVPSRKEETTSKKESQNLIFHRSKTKRAENTLTSFLWRANLENCFRFWREIHFLPRKKISLQQETKIPYPLYLAVWYSWLNLVNREKRKLTLFALCGKTGHNHTSPFHFVYVGFLRKHYRIIKKRPWPL